jgi:hypothetical protein
MVLTVVESQPLRKITTKPIKHDRVTAQDKGEVEAWFKEYKKVLCDIRLVGRISRTLMRLDLGLGALEGRLYMFLWMYKRLVTLL